jgi:O-methyltransferase domain
VAGSFYRNRTRKIGTRLRLPGLGRRFRVKPSVGRERRNFPTRSFFSSSCDALLVVACFYSSRPAANLLFDTAYVVGRSRKYLESYCIDDRCSVIEGNFFESVPSGADTYMFRHILHDWTDEQSVQILNNGRKVIPNNGRLLIIEAVLPPGNESSLAKDFDMVMLVLPGGIERTEEEYRFLLEQADFQLNSISPTASVISVVEAIPI